MHWVMFYIIWSLLINGASLKLLLKMKPLCVDQVEASTFPALPPEQPPGIWTFEDGFVSIPAPGAEILFKYPNFL